MASISTLLTLPKTSNAFTEVKGTVAERDDSGSASPRRKVPRLDTDSDSASASRSQAVLTSAGKSGPLTLHLVGGDIVSRPVPWEKELALLRRSIRVILNPNEEEILPATNQAIYLACRAVVVIADKGEGLHDALQMELEKCVATLTSACLAEDKDVIEWIGFFVVTCKWFETRINLLVELLTYLDQDYVVKHRLKSIRANAYSIFQERIFGNPSVVGSVREGVQEWVRAERNARAPHDCRSQIPLLIGHLVTHGQYSAFEDHYVHITQQYYTEESERLARENQKEPQVFFRHVQERIREEEERSEGVLPMGSWRLVRETTERALWNGRLGWLADETIGPYMVARDFKSLETMYTLFARVDGLKVLCASFRKHLRTTVSGIVKDPAQDEDMVERLLEFKHLANDTIDNSFSHADSSHTPSTSTVQKQPDRAFVYALTDAFTLGFKTRRNKPAELIAKHLDKAMRKGQGGSSDAEFDAMLDDVLGLYRYSEDKDVFRTFYHRSLAKRLLLGKSASDDFEASMLKKLKEEYDPDFGMGEDMFKDLALSRESMRDYHSKLDLGSPGRKLNAMVLQRSAWPFSKNDKTIDLPPRMQEELSKYVLYYKNKHSGHALAWDHGLGTATLKARFKPGVKELSVSLYQAVILLLFNESAQLSFLDIKEQTRLEDDDLRRTMQSLACGKKKVLRKVPPGRDVDDDDIFHFNADFEDSRSKIHINSIQARVSPEESKRTNDAIEGDRKLYLDAAIVRVMKANKTMMYEKLKTAAIDAVKKHFVPQVEVIKERVDSLVESDYLERDKVERNKFHYVA